MRKTIAGGILALVAVMPFTVSAHEHQAFEINGEYYSFTIGSLNEPIIVDDKTGVDFRAMKGEGAAAVPVIGLEETLQVELIAGDKTKVLDFSPVYGSEGAYKAPFYPTVATTLSYRVFGTIEGTPFEYTFTCSPAGHATAEEDTSRVEVADGVVRVLKTGSYGCPAEKAPMGFPEESADMVSLKTPTEDGGDMVSYGAGALALLALGVAFLRRRQ